MNLFHVHKSSSNHDVTKSHVTCIVTYFPQDVCIKYKIHTGKLFFCILYFIRVSGFPVTSRIMKNRFANQYVPPTTIDEPRKIKMVEI